MKDIMYELAYLPASRPQALPDMVVDMVASLLQEAHTTPTIATAVTAAIRQLCHAAHAFPSTSMTLSELGEEAIAGATVNEEVKLPEKQDNRAEPLLVNLRITDPQETHSSTTITTKVTAAFNQL
ncbi:hypothetical protein SKAU_G00102430 [Synaphobranchus kaupii]|uniref:Uncharacterized protein n=1 Tax=Synaphobranchus kaupii TaxID=118154 RepID=A0A9Q1J5D9_SYNKA|nr:hypothetical protein SKAU_G00102430 [Synaphobranchus kaupii]